MKEGPYLYRVEIAHITEMCYVHAEPVFVQLAYLAVEIRKKKVTVGKSVDLISQNVFCALSC